MQVKHWLYGMLTIRITCADPNAVINHLSQNDISVSAVTWIDEVTTEVVIPYKGRKYIKYIERKYNCEITIIKTTGLRVYVKKLISRPVFILGLAFFLLISFYIQNHILFIEVTGDHLTDKRQILEYAENCGLYFGAPRKSIRSEFIKNKLLHSLPQLQWVGINTSGCVATISVKKRMVAAEDSYIDQSPASIVASRDGTITEILSSKGTIQCQVGQQVVAGQTLISGTNKCGEIMLLTRAQGEVFANTQRNISLISIPPTLQRTKIQHTNRSFSIIFRKKLINLQKGSGILDTTCVKISNNYNLRLPGDFMLPLKLCCDTIISWETAGSELTEENMQWLLQQGRDYISGQMIAGEVIDESTQNVTTENVVKYDVRYLCKEMIGQIKKEELFCLYGKNS